MTQSIHRGVLRHAVPRVRFADSFPESSRIDLRLRDRRPLLDGATVPMEAAAFAAWLRGRAE